MPEVAFVTQRFYSMPKKRAGFIIATYEGEKIDWGLLSAEAPLEHFSGIQQKGKMMKTIIARWLAVLFPPRVPKTDGKNGGKHVPKDQCHGKNGRRKNRHKPNPFNRNQNNNNNRFSHQFRKQHQSLHPRLSPYHHQLNQSGICTCGGNRNITAPTKNEAEGSAVSAKEAEGTNTEKEKNGANVATNTTFSDSGISPTYPNRFGTRYNDNGASCQSQ